MDAPKGGKGAPHRPVLLDETIGLLEPYKGGLFVDGTLGLGGHSEAILLASPDTSVIGLDRDREALRWATKRLSRFGERFRAVHSDFRDIRRVLIHPLLRRSSGIVGEVAVLGYLTYLEVWELEKFRERLLSDPYTEEDEAAIARLGI